MPTFILLQRGDPAPWFKARSASNPSYVFHVAAGRNLVLCFVNSTTDPGVGALIQAAFAASAFDDARASFFLVTRDPEDESQNRIGESMPGKRVFWDFDGAIARAYGAVAEDDQRAWRPLWVVLDPALRVIDAVECGAAPPEQLIAKVAALPAPDAQNEWPPVLSLPNVLEPELCEKLVAFYRARGGVESGFMREHEGETVLVQDHAHKRRRDVLVDDQALINALQERVKRRIVPEIAKAFQFNVTRMERYLIGCYAADDGGHFRPHRDNTTKGTAHRRFAVTINLNDAFEGGELSFPEFGPRSFKPPPGGAIVFSCSLLHAASRVTKGERYAFLPFLYDEAAAAIREQNNPHLGEAIDAYRKD